MVRMVATALTPLTAPASRSARSAASLVPPVPRSRGVFAARTALRAALRDGHADLRALEDRTARGGATDEEARRLAAVRADRAFLRDRLAALATGARAASGDR